MKYKRTMTMHDQTFTYWWIRDKKAVNGALDLAMSSDHPRAYEVAGQLIKHVGDVADKLMALQKDKKNVKEESAKKVVTNNSLFVGSTADLQKMLKEASKRKRINSHMAYQRNDENCDPVSPQLRKNYGQPILR